MYLPFYKYHIEPETVEERRKHLYGFIYSPFRMKDLIKGILSDELKDLHLDIYDGNSISESNLLYRSDSSLNSNPKFKAVSDLVFNNHQWKLVIFSLPSFEQNIDEDKPRFILILGLTISILAFGVAIVLTLLRQYFNRYTEILESTSEGIYGVDLKGNCTFINKAATQMLKLEPEECLNKNLHDLVHHSHKDKSIYPLEECPIQNSLIKNENCQRSDEVFWRADGSYFPVEYSVSPIIEQNVVKGAVITFKDITEVKKAAQLIQNSLLEKDILIKEIHHRVKNNMQIISSLLNLQSRNIEEKKALDILKESQNRIRSMALVHEKLYQTKDLMHINLADYVKELSANLINSYQKHSNYVDLTIETDEIFLSIDNSIYLGLIINELLTNSLKHAFSDRKNGIVKIIIKNVDGIMLLSVKDNGVGMPKNFKIDETERLGFQIVNSLIIQLNGKLEIISNGGTEIKISFPAHVSPTSS
jgi:PAS domain S-box-containing protein